MEISGTNKNILAIKADCIVNSWNRNIIPWWLLLPQGVSGALKKTAGHGIFNELGYKSLPLGETRVTSAGRLSDRYKCIIHVAGINMLWTASEYSVKQSVTNSLHEAVKQKCQSIAFPIIGAGSGGMKIDKALMHMIEAANQSTTKPDKMIISIWGHQAERFGVNKLMSLI